MATQKNKPSTPISDEVRERMDAGRLDRNMERLRNLKITPEYESLLPSLSQEEYATLEDSIRREGCREAILYFVDENGEEVLLDGHNRRNICLEHGRYAHIKRINLSGGMSVEEWIIRNQVGRRNTNLFQRVEVILKLKDKIATRAKENQQKGGGAVRQKSAKPVNTRQELATMAGVSTDTVSKVDYILKNADVETITALRSGSSDVSINGFYKTLKGKETPEKPRPKRNTPKPENAPAPVGEDLIPARSDATDVAADTEEPPTVEATESTNDDGAAPDSTGSLAHRAEESVEITASVDIDAPADNQGSAMVRQPDSVTTWQII